MITPAAMTNINNIISDCHDRNLKTKYEVEAFLEQRKKQTKDINTMKKAVSTVSNSSNFEQRQYDNLDFLYANAKIDNKKGDLNV